jgi:hypothetical protein
MRCHLDILNALWEFHYGRYLFLHYNSYTNTVSINPSSRHVISLTSGDTYTFAKIKLWTYLLPHTVHGHGLEFFVQRHENKKFNKILNSVLYFLALNGHIYNISLRPCQLLTLGIVQVLIIYK